MSDGGTYVVATHAYLLAVTLDAGWRVNACRVIATGHHYGLALSGATLRAVSRDLGAAHESSLVAYGVGSDLDLHEIERRPLLGMREVHQAAYFDGALYLANTARNSIVRQGLDGSGRQEYHFGGHTHDANHPNSVFLCGEYVLVLLHNWYRESQVAVLRHDQATSFRLANTARLWHAGCHNLLVDGTLLYYNASRAGRFVAVDMARRRVIRSLPFIGHTKGLSATDHHFVIGVSELAPRENRYASRGSLAVIDRHSLDVVATVDLNRPDLPGPVGNVNEIRCVSAPELSQSGPSATLPLHSLKLAGLDPWLRLRGIASRVVRSGRRLVQR